MVTTVYVVCGSRDDWEDTRTWLVKAFADEASAHDWVAKAQTRANQLAQRYLALVGRQAFDALDALESQNTYDPNMGRPVDVEYYVEAVAFQPTRTRKAPLEKTP